MAQTRNAGQGILADDNAGVREEIIAMLQKAYWMEIETVMSYIANSVNPDGVTGLRGAAELPAAARAPDRRRARRQGRDRGRDRRDRALQRGHREDRARRPGDQR